MVIRHRDTLNSAASDDGGLGDDIETPGSQQPYGDGSTASTAQLREVSLESVLEQSEEITRTTGIEPNYTNLSVEPSFFALQLFPFGDLGSPTLEDSPSNFRPLKVPDQPIFQRAVEMIDYLPVVDFHKIGGDLCRPRADNGGGDLGQPRRLKGLHQLLELTRPIGQIERM
ncbi:Tuberous sclerosis 2-like protein [Puccinia graminis f. sp. tritici]|uniref:Tuberous sclerosis 2-like protein n=1 Tax=Puccinia graminis f. sp. tritici TaxID=56615 RepID=A0A5B0RPJ8_PUCGR|nr:Tuberous sclerosis 2-like protein [Puccinia graminis f. sp. tritici]